MQNTLSILEVVCQNLEALVHSAGKAAVSLTGHNPSFFRLIIMGRSEGVIGVWIIL